MRNDSADCPSTAPATRFFDRRFSVSAGRRLHAPRRSGDRTCGKAAYRGGYPVLPLVSQYVFGGVPPDPSQPIGHSVTPTGPNGYVYEPVYSSDVEAARRPTLAVPQTDTTGEHPGWFRCRRRTRNRLPSRFPRPAAQPEAIPLPVPEAGPREF